ncbi:MAG: alpha-hydroxy acid oxidase [Rhodospirillaceae bacterium]
MPDASAPETENKTASPDTAPPHPRPAGDTELRMRYPTSADLRARARRTLPNFAFEYCDGGAGADTGIQRNWAAFDAIQMVPRYGLVVAPPPCDTTIFGRPYAAPVGVAPIGSPGTTLPGAETFMAKAAQAARVPYTLGLLSGIDIERAAEIAPDVLWLQLYRFPRDDHRIGLDLVRRAEVAGVHVLVLTMDTPTRTTRPREVKSGIGSPFRLTARMRLDALSSPHWMRAMARNGIPRFVSLAPYMKPGTGLVEATKFIQRESGGAFTWDEVARYRDRWKKPLVLKGILHPEDAERAISLGLDGLIVSNHGGRQIDGLPAAIDALPAVAKQASGRISLILDSGVRSGVDVARAVALGADAALAGKAFLWSLGALGGRGPAHLIDLFMEDLSSTLGQLGCRTVDELRTLAVRHAAAWSPEEFASRG